MGKDWQSARIRQAQRRARRTGQDSSGKAAARRLYGPKAEPVVVDKETKLGDVDASGIPKGKALTPGMILKQKEAIGSTRGARPGKVGDVFGGLGRPEAGPVGAAAGGLGGRPLGTKERTTTAQKAPYPLYAQNIGKEGELGAPIKPPYPLYAQNIGNVPNLAGLKRDAPYPGQFGVDNPQFRAKYPGFISPYSPAGSKQGAGQSLANLAGGFERPRSTGGRGGDYTNYKTERENYLTKFHDEVIIPMRDEIAMFGFDPSYYTPGQLKTLVQYGVIGPQEAREGGGGGGGWGGVGRGGGRGGRGKGGSTGSSFSSGAGSAGLINWRF